MDYSKESNQPWGGREKPHLNPWDVLSPRDFANYEEYKERQSEIKDLYASDTPRGIHHRRMGRELAKPPSDIVLISMIDARFAYLNSEKAFDEIDFFQTAIRGTGFHSRELLSVNTWGECLLELVPEPSHKSDPNALAVDLKGTRIGYVSASIASFFQGMVRGLRQSGKRVYTPGYVFKPSNGVLVLPTISKMNQLMLSESSLTIKEFWETLPSEFHQKVFDNNYHFNRETASELFSHREVAPLFAPYDRNAPEEAVPMLWEAFLRDMRKAHNKAALRKRLHRNKAMARLAAKGLSYREIGEEYSLTASTVGNIVRDLRRSDSEFSKPVTVASTKPRKNSQTLNNRHGEYYSVAERNKAILQMKSEGLTHREIGELVGLHRDTVKKIVQKVHNT